MIQNVGNTDRLIRFVVAAVAIVAAVVVNTTAGWIIGGLVAAIMLITGLTSTCPIWIALKVNTRSKAEGGKS